MYSLYSREDYPAEWHQYGQTMDTCKEVIRMLARVDVVRALSMANMMHLLGQSNKIPDQRADFSDHIALLEAAKTLWLLARYAAKEWQEDRHDEGRHEEV